MQALFETEEFQKLSEEFRKIFDRQNELEPMPKAANYIWLYRNNGGESATSAPATDAEPKFDPGEFAVRASFQPQNAAAGDEVILTVYVNVPQGFHIYGSSSDTQPTTLNITEDGGLKSNGAAGVPEGRMVIDSGKPAFWLEDVVKIQQRMTVPAEFESATVEGHVAYMMCNEQGCQPPTTEKFSATVTAK